MTGFIRKEYIKGGIGKLCKGKTHNQIQLDMGIKVELEHTKNRKIAKQIALDHLCEFPKYYTELAKMEKRLKSRKGRK